jgi:hypothetical protein
MRYETPISDDGASTGAASRDVSERSASGQVPLPTAKSAGADVPVWLPVRRFLARRVRLRYLKTPMIPCAVFAFKGASSSSQGAREELAQLLERNLRERLVPVEVPGVYSKYYFTAVRVGQVPFGLNLRANVYEVGEFIVGIAPATGWNLSTWLRGSVPADSFQGLMLLCGEINALLGATPQIAHVRWYFEGPFRLSKAFATPDALPWIETYGERSQGPTTQA